MAAPFLFFFFFPCMCARLHTPPTHRNRIKGRAMLFLPCNPVWFMGVYYNERFLLGLQGKGIYVGLASYLVLKKPRKYIINHSVFIWIVIKEVIWGACHNSYMHTSPVTILKHNYSVAYIYLHTRVLWQLLQHPAHIGGASLFFFDAMGVLLWCVSHLSW